MDKASQVYAKLLDSGQKAVRNVGQRVRQTGSDLKSGYKQHGKPGRPRQSAAARAGQKTRKGVDTTVGLAKDHPYYAAGAGLGVAGAGAGAGYMAKEKRAQLLAQIARGGQQAVRNVGQRIKQTGSDLRAGYTQHGKRGRPRQSGAAQVGQKTRKGVDKAVGTAKAHPYYTAGAGAGIAGAGAGAGYASKKRREKKAEVVFHKLID